MKKFYFMAGLPRSGSTLLSSILNQNPKIHSSSNSPMAGMMVNLEKSILSSEQYNAYPKPIVMPKVIQGVLESYYSDVDNEIIIDKCREWPINENLECLLRNMPYDPKIIITTRDILDILASFIKLINENEEGNNIIDANILSSGEMNLYGLKNDIRCDYLMKPKGMIDNCLYGIYCALIEENKKYFHIVEYEDIINNTEETINKIYKFLDLEYFEHDFNNIKNTVKEDDSVYGLIGQHDVRKTISKRQIDKENILSSYVLNKYSNLEFWRNSETSL